MRRYAVAACVLAILVGCAPKEDNNAVKALKNEKTAWERESNLAAQEATDAVSATAKKNSGDADEVQ